MATALQSRLIDLAVECMDDPLKFVYVAFPWGKDGTLLAHEDGPDDWQAEVLESIRRHMDVSLAEALRDATASGHGVGKSALCAWIILWFMTTRPHPQVICTANTLPQLQTKTWRELAKWHRLSLWADQYKWTATKFYHVEYPETWFASAIPWSVDKPEAFAGTHEKHVLILYDEASAIPDIIWETTEGAMTTPGAMWFVFGNPTRNTGRFRDCFPGRRFAHRWTTRQVDSRTAKMADRGQLDEWVGDYGEDSDFVRVRVRGVFPRTSALQFIGEALVETAKRRAPERHEHLALVLGVDVARFGDDQSVILGRQGSVILYRQTYRDLDTMQFASLVADAIDTLGPQVVFIDIIGIGSGVFDRLKQLGYGKVLIAVNAGEVAADERRYANKRAEMWDRMRAWIKETGCLPPDAEGLAADLQGPEYGYDIRERIQLERKKDMKKRGLASPDEADALAMTFALPVRVREEPAPEDDDWLEAREGMTYRSARLGWME